MKDHTHSLLCVWCNTGWPKNARGGLKVGLPPMKRAKHDGKRCYGEHEGKRCLPYDFSVHPVIPPGIFVLRPEGCKCPSGEYARGWHNSACPLWKGPLDNDAG